MIVLKCQVLEEISPGIVDLTEAVANLGEKAFGNTREDNPPASTTDDNVLSLECDDNELRGERLEFLFSQQVRVI